MYKEDLTLNNLQWLICLQTKPNETITSYQSGFGSNGNEWVLHIPQMSRTESSTSDAVYWLSS